VNTPIRLDNKNTWFKRPGSASTLTPMVGIAHEWMTSAEDTKQRIAVFLGRFNKSLVFRRRIRLEFSMNMSISDLFIPVFSYDQYHW
jgi:hypothetical protein